MTPYNIRYRLYVIQLYTGFTVEYKRLSFEIKSTDDKGSEFSGYASTTDLDQGGDIIVKGAFARTLKERGSRVKMLWNHDSRALPVGKWARFEERDNGLYVEGKVSDTTMGRDIKTLLADGALDAMSIGYITRDADYNDDGVRVIKDLDLFEVSVVNMPMNESALITDVKSANPKDLERILRDAGLSRREAKALVAGGWKNLRDAGNQEEVLLAEVKSALDNLFASIRQEKTL